MASLVGLTVLAAALSGPAMAFVSDGSGASTHVTITRNGLLETVMTTCQAVAERNNYEFKPTGKSAKEIVRACLDLGATNNVSETNFQAALEEIYIQNKLVDRDFVNSASHHFHSEAFLEGRSLITEGMAAIKASIHTENFQAARETLGRILHTLQDFYSHSNWVELNYTEPYINLIRPYLPIENIADMNTPTCRDCANDTCPDPILPSVLERKKLTSGYMGTKPSGKCSHGGSSDLTRGSRPRGGISKDELRADNKYYHEAAVKVATAASVQLLEDIHLAVGDEDFLRMMGIFRPPALCFVIDTTSRMSDEIKQVQDVLNAIVDSKSGTLDEPSEYILVPFNHTEFGPVFRTADPEVMKKELSEITVNGDGNQPKMVFSAIQLALTTAPAYSQIYVFTDATAKDAHLKDTLVSLIRFTRSTVNFFTTSGRRRRRRSTGGGTFEDYKDLALASGGQAIQVTKGQLPQATAITLDTSTSALSTDFYPPLCEIVNIVDACPHLSQCKDYVWEVSANLTDGNGTGIENVNLNRGNGTLTRVIDSDPAQYRYNASCCAEVMEIVAVDKIGNVGRCFHSIERSGSAPAPKRSALLMLSLLFSVFIVRPN